MGKHEYIVRIRRDKLPAAPTDWLEKVRATPGVELLGSYGHQATVLTDTEGVTQLRSQLEHVAIIEETKDRTPGDSESD